MPPDIDTAILCPRTDICQVFIDTLFGTAFYLQVINFVPEVTPKTLRTVELQLEPSFNNKTKGRATRNYGGVPETVIVTVAACESLLPSLAA